MTKPKLSLLHVLQAVFSGPAPEHGGSIVQKFRLALREFHYWFRISSVKTLLNCYDERVDGDKFRSRCNKADDQGLCHNASVNLCRPLFQWEYSQTLHLGSIYLPVVKQETQKARNEDIACGVDCVHKMERDDPIQFSDGVA